MGARLEELKTCNDLIEKHGQALQVRITCFLISCKRCSAASFFFIKLNFLWDASK